MRQPLRYVYYVYRIAAVGAGSGFDSGQMENLSEAIALSHYLNRILQSHSAEGKKGPPAVVSVVSSCPIIIDTTDAEENMEFFLEIEKKAEVFKIT